MTAMQGLDAGVTDVLSTISSGALPAALACGFLVVGVVVVFRIVRSL